MNVKCEDTTPRDTKDKKAYYLSIPEEAGKKIG